MLPPIEDSILQSNPKFAVLHASLSNNILNTNGSTKNHASQKERDAVSESYKAAHLRNLKIQILINALSSLDLTTPSTSSTTTTSKTKPIQQTANPLPLELISLILLLTSLLTSPTQIPAKTTTLLRTTETLSSLPIHLPKIGHLLSTHLQTQNLSLTRIAFPITNPSFLHRQIPSLPLHTTTLTSKIKTQNEVLTSQRLALVSTTTKILQEYQNLNTKVIEILEQSKYGSISRHANAKTDYLVGRGREVEGKGREKLGRGREVVYSGEVRGALGNYLGELRCAGERMGEREREAKRVLWGYGVGREEEGGNGKERKMGEIGRVYGELMGEMEGVRRDIERMGG